MHAAPPKKLRSRLLLAGVALSLALPAVVTAPGRAHAATIAPLPKIKFETPVGTPAVLSLTATDLDVFARMASGRVMVTSYSGSTGWGLWKNLGVADASSDPKAVIVNYATRTVDVAVMRGTGTAKALWHATRRGTAWSGWTKVVASAASRKITAPMGGNPAITADGSKVVYAVRFPAVGQIVVQSVDTANGKLAPERVIAGWDPSDPDNTAHSDPTLASLQRSLDPFPRVYAAYVDGARQARVYDMSDGSAHGLYERVLSGWNAAGETTPVLLSAPGRPLDLIFTLYGGELVSDQENGWPFGSDAFGHVGESTSPWGRYRGNTAAVSDYGAPQWFVRGYDNRLYTSDARKYTYGPWQQVAGSPQCTGDAAAVANRPGSIYVFCIASGDVFHPQARVMGTWGTTYSPLSGAWGTLPDPQVP